MRYRYQPYRRGMRVFPWVFPILFPLIIPFGLILAGHIFSLVIWFIGFLLLMALLSMVIVLIPQTKRFLWIAGGVALLVTIWDLITLSHVEKVGAQWGVFVVILGALAILASAFVPERGPDGRWTLDI